MKPQLTLQTPLELPPQEISNYLKKLWISEGEDSSGANTFTLIIWQPAWLEQSLVNSQIINGPVTGNLSSELIKKAKDLIIIGDQSTVIDKLIEFIDIVGPFGTLLITGHDFGNSRKLWESSFTKMSENVEPILSKYLKQKFAA